MITSRMRTSKGTLPALSALLCLMLSVGSAAAQTVVETVHYQAEIGLDCTLGNHCYGAFPKPGSKRRLTITRVTCAIRGAAGSKFGDGFIYLIKPDNTVVLSYPLPGDHSGANGLHMLNRAVDVQVGANQHILATLTIDQVTASAASCTATGTLDRLQ